VIVIVLREEVGNSRKVCEPNDMMQSAAEWTMSI